MAKQTITEQERARLRVILKPYADRFIGLQKRPFIPQTEYILLQFTELGSTVADKDAEVEETEGPSFPAGRFFAGLQLDKWYTAEDLGLWL